MRSRDVRGKIDVVINRMKINEVERIARNEPQKRRHFSIKEVTEILNRAGIRVSESNLRRWIRMGLCPAIKKTKKYRARWWLLPSHIIEFSHRMHTLNEWYDRYRVMRKTRIRVIYRDRPLPPRDELGRFTKEVKKQVTARDRYSMLPSLQ